MDPIVVDTILGESDWRAYVQAIIPRARGRLDKVRGALIALMFAVLFFVAGAFDPNYILVMVAGFVALSIVSRLSQRTPSMTSAFAGHSRMELSASGIHDVRDRTQSHIVWSAFREVTSTPTHVFVWFDRLSGYTIPIRDLPADLDAATLTGRIRDWIGPSAAPPEPAPPAPLPTRALWTFIGAVATLAIWCAFDYYEAGPGAMWTGYGLAGLSWYVLCVLAFVWMISLVSAPALSFWSVASIVGIALPFVTTAVLAIETWADPAVAVWGYAAVAMATIAYLAWRFRVARVRSLFVSVWTAFIVASLTVWASQHMYAPTRLWYAQENEEGETGSGEYYESEQTLFTEPARIDAALDDVAATSGDRPLLYFVGFAGYGEQHVFGAEVAFAAQIVDECYATATRSLLLVNDVDDRDSHPLATVAGLERALKGVAAKMNLERDALFLFLTSHGSDDPELSVSNGMLPLRPLTGDSLAHALDVSGIEWRVVVISACHSGAFIEPLRNERTIVLTAAAAERTSFGCSDERDLTYFGEAFFRDALPNAPSLLDAFEAAKRAIAEREKSENISPSEPQVFVGAEIAERWSQYEPEVHEWSDPEVSAQKLGKNEGPG